MPNSALLPGGILSMTGAAADRLVAAGNGDAALLYLCLLGQKGGNDARAAMSALKWDVHRLGAAHRALAKLGLVAEAEPPAPPPAPSDEPPEYTYDDITKELENDASSFPALVGEVQRRLGKVLSTADLKVLYTLYDFLALPAEVICLLVSHCVEDIQRTQGEGRKPRMSQIRREAFAWHRQGVRTMETAEAHLKRLSSLRERERALLPLLGIRDRPPIEKEREYLAAWTDMGFPDEAIRLAYEKTVLKKRELSWPYMNSILLSWHRKNLHTLAQIQAGDSAGRGYNKPPVSGPAVSAQDDKRVAENLDWMRKFLARQKEEEQ